MGRGFKIGHEQGVRNDPVAVVTSAAFDPATLALTGWWRADYTASPWVGTASAGSSGSRNLTEDTNPPSTRAINGLTAADFDGTNDRVSTSLTTDDYLNASAWSAWALFYADTAAADIGAGARFFNTQFFGGTGDAAFGVGFSDAGIHVHQLDGAQKEIVIACGTGAWHLLQAKYDGTDLKLRLDSGSWSSLAAGNISSMTFSPIFCGWSQLGVFFDGAVADLGVADFAISDGDFDGVIEYVNDRYGLAI